MGQQDTVMFILDDHHTVVRTQWVIAVNMTLRSRSEGQQLPQHLLLAGQMRTNVINPSLDRRLGNGNQKERGKDQRNVPETDTAHHSKIAGQADAAVAHMLGGRYAFDFRGKVQAVVLGI